VCGSSEGTSGTVWTDSESPVDPGGFGADGQREQRLGRPCCRALHDAGVTEIAIVVTHGLFTGDRWRALLAEGVQTIVITDTVRSRRRPVQAQVTPVAPLPAAVLAGRGH
jgi:hypothetical protein